MEELAGQSKSRGCEKERGASERRWADENWIWWLSDGFESAEDRKRVFAMKAMRDAFKIVYNNQRQQQNGVRREDGHTVAQGAVSSQVGEGIRHAAASAAAAAEGGAEAAPLRDSRMPCRLAWSCECSASAETGSVSARIQLQF